VQEKPKFSLRLRKTAHLAYFEAQARLGEKGIGSYTIDLEDLSFPR
jgi:hypothetical protein